MAKASDLFPVVSDILFRQWDPIGVNDNELCRDEYDGYVPELVHLLLSGADEYKLASWLRRVQSDSMGMSVIDDGWLTDRCGAPHTAYANKERTPDPAISVKFASFRKATGRVTVCR